MMPTHPIWARMVLWATDPDYETEQKETPMKNDEASYAATRLICIQEGEKAYRAGTPLYLCPYNTLSESELFLHWRTGWLSEQLRAKRRKKKGKEEY